jgi:ribosome biogenesis protein NSA2
VNVSELGLVTPAGKVVWGKASVFFKKFSNFLPFPKSRDMFHNLMFLVFAGKYAQVTNNPENDGCINAVLLV